MRLPRLTTRRLMVIVAGVAVAIGGSIALERRRAGFRRLVDRCALAEMGATTTMGYFDHPTTRKTVAEMNGEFHTDAEWEAILAADRRKAAYFAKLKAKYERAARYPWLPVPPDPPEPK